jgi:hypothetical protein
MSLFFILFLIGSGVFMIYDYEYTVDAKDEDLNFAIQASTNSIRPYPKGFIHKR